MTYEISNTVLEYSLLRVEMSKINNEHKLLYTYM